MTFKTLTKALLAGALAMGVTGAASAADTAATAKWKEKTSRHVGNLMVYPRLSTHRLKMSAHNIVDLKIDHSGRVLDTAFVKSSGIPQFDRASMIFTDRVSKLPRLPDAEYQNGAFVRVHLFYGDTRNDIAKMMRTVTETTRIASAETGAEGAKIAGVPTIDLFMITK